MSRLAAARFALSTLALVALCACGDTPGVPTPRDDKVTSVTVSPSTVAMLIGDKVPLSAAVAVGPDQVDRRVRWSSENPMIGTVDDTGLVSGLAAGVTKITATSLADTTVTGTAVIIVGGFFGPSVTIAAINHNGAPVDLSNAFGTLDVLVNIDGSSPLVSRADLVMNSAGADTVVATYSPGATTAPGPVTLTVNTVGLRNGQWTLKVRVTLTSGTVTVSSTVAVAIKNP